MFFIFTDKNTGTIFPNCFFHTSHNTHPTWSHAQSIPCLTLPMAKMNVNCSFEGYIWMPPSLKPFKRATNLCNTDHPNSNLLGALTYQLTFWPLGSQRQTGQLQIPAHLSCTNLLQPIYVKFPEFCPLHSPHLYHWIQIPGKFSPYLKNQMKNDREMQESLKSQIMFIRWNITLQHVKIFFSQMNSEGTITTYF